ncbi:hypothetical protein [Hamadaea tsunoensis]|uniref:hypothetical protein n=1 Tax=Hamadaea tsunoensis TaxID=53368 RepID=UPI0012F79888|nr:hypothetical protein [Hamadaea tsunoensis]
MVAAEGEPSVGSFYTYNAGSSTCIVQDLSYQFRLASCALSGGLSHDESSWQPRRTLVSALRAAGLREDRDYFVARIGSAPLPPIVNPLEGLHLLTLNWRTIACIESLSIRITVTDIIGDTHERVFNDFFMPAHLIEVQEYENARRLAADATPEEEVEVESFEDSSLGRPVSSET